MDFWDKGEKVCATCVYWRGIRKVEFSHIESNKSRGNCGNDEDGEKRMGLETFHSMKCPCWRGFSNG